MALPLPAFVARSQSTGDEERANKASKVTREVTAHLAALAQALEKAGHPSERVAAFLMRFVSTRFAEAVGLLPPRLDGGLLLELELEPRALPLTPAHLGLLLEAARCDWADVEPAIFGTLLERALDPRERHALGAHYTPRAYVERLVRPTLEEPLRADWEIVQAEVQRRVLDAAESEAPGDLTEARAALRAFHEKLTTLRVLDPACGSGNFLYVALDLVMRLEGEVLAALEGLGEEQELLRADALRVTPAQFLGIEKKRWAKEIAELVLRVGYLQHHFRAHGESMPVPAPVFQDHQSIECRDALLAWDGIELQGAPMPAAWPSADFIVGNPPYLGARTIRPALGDAYVDALRAAYKDVPDTADLVMYWWHKAALAVEAGVTRRFGFITTSSIVQEYSRRVLQQHVDIPGGGGVVLSFAVAEHPWFEARDGADVTVAMTVAARPQGSARQAMLGRVVPGTWGDEEARVEVTRVAHINSSLTAGSAVRGIAPLAANQGMCFQGVVPAGDGFKLSTLDLRALGYEPDDLPPPVRPYIIGRDLVQTASPRFIIDFFGLSEREARDHWPDLFQRVHDRVLPARSQNHRSSYRDRWWIFAEPRPAMRRGLRGLKRFIATPYTAKFRPFVYVDGATLPDAMAYAVVSDDAAILGALSSRVHRLWALAAGGRLGVGNDPRYTSNATFAPFPFPAGTLAQQRRIRDLGEQLDAHRKRQQARYPDLTITGMYNVLEKLCSGEPLTEKDKITHEHGLVSVLRQIHDDLDAAVFDAYGWPRDLTDEQILEKLVALNAERAEEERNGHVRWLRPDFQNPGGIKALTQETMEGLDPDAEEAGGRGRGGGHGSGDPHPRLRASG